MKLSEFILLNEEDKKMTVLQEGVLVAKRSNTDYMVFLFQLNSYYVETYCNRENRSIEEYRVFDSLKPLHPYLETISLEGLIGSAER
jgi:hypothetical protein